LANKRAEMALSQSAFSISERNLKKSLLSFILLGSLVAFFCSKSEWMGRTYTEDGVPVIENHGPGIWGENINKKISFSEDFTLGKESGENHVMFHTDIDVAVDPDANIYVLDMRNNRFLKFDKDGNHLWTAGKQGQGPGELLGPSKIKINPYHQEICVLDSFFKLHIYDLEGYYNRTIRSDRAIEDFQYLSDERIFAQITIPQQTGLAGAYLNSQFEFLEKFPAEYSYGPKISGGGYIGGNIEYIQDIIYMVLPDIYEIREYDGNGNLLRKIKRDFSFDPPEVKRLERGGFSITGRTKIGPCFRDKRGFLINQVSQIKGETEKDIEVQFFLDFIRNDGKFLGSYFLPKWTKLISVDFYNKYYFVTISPFPKVIRSTLEIK